jgi:aspartyl-tRNA(Asn)/glutamyl-tRNA(Gln) amidotransferase subunit C
LWYDAGVMTHDEIKKLGTLSRIALSEGEVATFSQEIDAILAYVSTVKNIADQSPGAPVPGVRYNVLRSDEVSNVPGQYTTAMLASMPKTSGQYLSVKKILKQTD